MTHTPATLPGGEDAQAIREALLALWYCYGTGLDERRQKVKDAREALDRMLAAAPEPPLNRSAADRNWKTAFEEEHEIVARIWRQLGSPSYEELKGRSIYDLIDEQKSRAANRSALVEEMAKALEELSIEVGRTGWQNADPAPSRRTARVGLLNRSRAVLAKFRARESAP